MNRLVAFLQTEKNLTTGRLKQLFRLLSKRTHPDVAKGPDRSFVYLRREYEEALEILRGQKAVFGQRVDGSSLGGNPRDTVLAHLYLYSLKFFCSDSEKMLLGLIQASYAYDIEIAGLLKSYYAVFLKHFHEWQHVGRIYYAHNIFISSIKQLAYYHSFSIIRHRKLLLVYLEELRKRAAGLDGEQATILTRLADWLEDELGKGGVKIL